MLLQFSVSNYRCFRGLQTLNLAATPKDKTLPENCLYPALPSLKSKRWVRAVALYGANASGKTTVLRALQALKELVQESAKSTDPNEPIGQIDPFALDGESLNNPTAFGVSFVAGDQKVRYEYRVAATKQRVWHESLRAFPVGKEQLWFSRDWDNSLGEYLWSPDRPTGFRRDHQLEKYTLSNTLFLSKAIASNHSELEEVFAWFKRKLQFFDLSHKGRASAANTKRRLQSDPVFKQHLVNILRHADLGIADARTIDVTPDDEFDQILSGLGLPAAMKEAITKANKTQPQLMHRGVSGQEFSLAWGAESAGTERLFNLVGPWLSILERGDIACFDELETSLHPAVVREVLKLFFNDESNPKGAQLLFTTHNPLMLDPTLLRRDQIWFADKDMEGASHLYPLTDYQPRRGESLIRGYLSGRYGGVPLIRKGFTTSVSEVQGDVNAEAGSFREH